MYKEISIEYTSTKYHGQKENKNKICALKILRTLIHCVKKWTLITRNQELLFLTSTKNTAYIISL
jgi:hypothetical protein